MAGMGAGYDLSVSTFSPDGRVFQVEYAAKAVDNSGTAMAVICKNGIIFAVEKFILSVMAIPAPRIFAVDRHITLAVAGFIADGREILSRARLEASEYRRVYDEPIPGKVLSERLALFIHAYTLAWSERPFGAAILLGVCDSDGYEERRGGGGVVPTLELYVLDCAGVCYKYFGAALGKGRQSAKTEMEKLNRQNLTMEEGLVEVARIMYKVHDETKEKAMELEMAWIGESSNWQHQAVPNELRLQAEERAKKLLETDEEGETDVAM